MLNIEKFSKQDLLQVEDISKTQFGAQSWQLNLFEEEIDKPDHFAFVGKLDKKVVCFVFAMKTYGESGEDINILNIATKKGYENQGLASELFAYIENLAREKNINQIWLEVRESNLNAIKFYKNLGFKLDYVRKKYYTNGDNALIMSVKL